MKASDLNELLCSPARLAIMATLMPGESKSFMELKSETGLKDGNLHVQTRKLAEAEYISIQRASRRTLFHITDLGNINMNNYIELLYKVKQNKPSEFKAAPSKRKADDSQVW